MTTNIELPNKINEINCKPKNTISVINELEFDSFKKEHLIKNKLPILLTLINNFPKKYSDNFILPDKSNKKSINLLKKHARQIIKRKIKLLTCRYRILIDRRKTNKNSEKDKFIKSTLLKILAEV